MEMWDRRRESGKIGEVRDAGGGRGRDGRRDEEVGVERQVRQVGDTGVGGQAEESQRKQFGERLGPPPQRERTRESARQRDQGSRQESRVEGDKSSPMDWVSTKVEPGGAQQRELVTSHRGNRGDRPRGDSGQGDEPATHKYH